MSPRSPDTIGQRVKLVRKRLGWTQDELAAAAGEKQPNISKLERGEIQTTTAIARLAGALRVAPRWLELGEGSESDNWTPSQPAPAGVASHPVAQDLRHPEPDDESPKHPWEFIVSVPASDLPKRFRAAMPDDALAPDTPRGLVLHFSTDAAPVIGHGVLVQDAAGGRHVRRYAQGLGGAWRAEARNTAYMTLHSGDGVQLLAVVTGRDSGEV